MVDTIVSTEGSEAARTPVAVGRNTPSMSAAWLLLAATATLFLAGRIAPLEMAHLVFFSMSIGLCAVSVFALLGACFK